MSTFKPVQAATVKEEHFKDLCFPMIATPKLDGIRCLIRDGKVVSRTLKPIRNEHIQGILGTMDMVWADGMDGELITYTDGEMDKLNTVSSKVMSRDGEPDFVWHVFDDSTVPSAPYWCRLEDLKCTVKDLNHPHVKYVQEQQVDCIEDLRQLEREYVMERGWEGLMLRDPEGVYKFGRSTLKQQLLLKWKRFMDDEATVVGFKELMRNNNEAKKDALGHTKRSNHKANKTPAGVMGVMEMQWANGTDFELGTGFTLKQRTDIWNDRKRYMGSTVTFKYREKGVNDAPLLPVFKAFRKDT